MEYLSRVYFSRYFYSMFKSSSKYKYRSLVNINQRTIFYSDIYYYNSKFGVNFSNSSNVMFWAINSISRFSSRNYIFPVIFAYRGNFDVFYDYFWKPYENNNEFFKKFIIIFIRLKFKYFTNFQLMVFAGIYKNLK